jgi:hypothetical protein
LRKVESTNFTFVEESSCTANSGMRIADGAGFGVSLFPISSYAGMPSLSGNATRHDHYSRRTLTDYRRSSKLTSVIGQVDELSHNMI